MSHRPMASPNSTALKISTAELGASPSVFFMVYKVDPIGQNLRKTMERQVIDHVNCGVPLVVTWQWLDTWGEDGEYQDVPVSKQLQP